MDDIFAAITTHGLAFVICVVVLYFAIRLGNILLDNFVRSQGKKEHDELVALRREVSVVINKYLERVVLLARANRAYVFEYHNGTVPLGGLPFLKMSCTYEALHKASPEQHKRENMPLLLFSSFADRVYTNDVVVLDVNNRTEGESPFMYEMLVERGVAITVRARITDLNKKVIGYAGVDYCDPVDEENVDHATSVMKEAATELGALLSVDKRRRGGA